MLRNPQQQQPRPPTHQNEPIASRFYANSVRSRNATVSPLGDLPSTFKRPSKRPSWSLAVSVAITVTAVLLTVAVVLKGVYTYVEYLSDDREYNTAALGGANRLQRRPPLAKEITKQRGRLRRRFLDHHIELKPVGSVEVAQKRIPKDWLSTRVTWGFKGVTTKPRSRVWRRLLKTHLSRLLSDLCAENVSSLEAALGKAGGVSPAAQLRFKEIADVMTRYEHVHVNRSLRAMADEVGRLYTASMPPSPRSTNAVTDVETVERNVQTEEEQEEVDDKEVRVRFLTTATRVNKFTQRSIVGATVSGVPLEIIGAGWDEFSLPKRYEVLLSYIEKQQLNDHDIILLIDNDAVFVGEDPYPAVEAFVTLSPASEAALTDVRGIRLGYRMAPMRFSVENNCMRRQVSGPNRCKDDYHLIENLMGSWCAEHGLPFLNNNDSLANPLQYLNSGFMIARVWALKRYIPAFRQFMAEHAPYEGVEWESDQSVTATLYLQLRWWEIASGALDGAPQPVSEEARLASNMTVIPELPQDGLGPYGLPGGLIDLDTTARFVVVLSFFSEDERSLYTFGHKTLDYSDYPQAAYKAFCEANATKLAVEQTGLPPGATRSPVGVSVVLDSLILSSRPGVDCTGNGTDLLHCRHLGLHNAIMGLPPSTTVAQPIRSLIWHFAGPEKETMFDRYYHIMPWRIPFDFSAAEKTRTQFTLWAAPKTAHWAVYQPTLPPSSTAIEEKAHSGGAAKDNDATRRPAVVLLANAPAQSAPSPLLLSVQQERRVERDQPLSGDSSGAAEKVNPTPPPLKPMPYINGDKPDRYYSFRAVCVAIRFIIPA